MMGKCLANHNLNKKRLYKWCFCCSWSARKNSVLETIDSKKCSTKLLHVCNQVCSSMFEFTENDDTTSSYWDTWKVKARGRLIIATILVLAITKSTAVSLVNGFSNILKNNYNSNLIIQALVKVWSYKSKHP